MKVSVTWDFSDDQRREIYLQNREDVLDEALATKRKASRGELVEWVRNNLIDAEIRLGDEMVARREGSSDDED